MSLESSDGTDHAVECGGAAVGTATELAYSAIPGCPTPTLTHGRTYVWRVQAVGCNGRVTARASDGVTVDTTAPDLSATTVNDGTHHREVDWQSHEERALSANWGGAIAEDESPVAYLEWALGTAPGGDDVMGWTVVRAACAPEAAWCAHCGPAVPAACAGPGTDVCVRLQYRMCGGQWGGLSTTYCRRWGPGCEGPVTFPLHEHTSPDGLLEYRVYRVHPDAEHRGCLKAQVAGPTLRPWTETHRHLETSCGGAGDVADAEAWELVTEGAEGGALDLAAAPLRESQRLRMAWGDGMRGRCAGGGGGGGRAEAWGGALDGAFPFPSGPA